MLFLNQHSILGFGELIRMASMYWIQGKPYVRAIVRGKEYRRRIPRTSASAAERWFQKFQRVPKIEKLAMLKVNELPAPSISREKSFSNIFLQYCEYMYQTHRWETTRKKISRFNVVWLPEFGDKQLDEITPGMVQAVLHSRRTDGKKHNTVHNDAKVLKAFFSWAIEERYVKENPVRKLPGIQLKDIIIPTPEQVQAYLSACDWDYYIVPAIAIHCGLRKQEILNLDIQDIDFNQREIHVRPESSWKNVQGRIVPIRPDLMGCIEKYIRETPQRRTDALIVSADGYRTVNIDKRHRAARKAAGLPWLTFHHFRPLQIRVIAGFRDPSSRDLTHRHRTQPG